MGDSVQRQMPTRIAANGDVVFVEDLPPGQANPVMAQPVSGYQSGGAAYRAVPVGEPQSQDEYGREQPDVQNMLCQCCCPCCTGDPSTGAWWKNAARNWLTTFVGLLCLVQAGLYFAMVGVGDAQKIPDNTLVDFGGIDAPRIVHQGQIYRLLMGGLLLNQAIEMVLVLFIVMTLGYMCERTEKWGFWAMAAIWVGGTTVGSLTSCLVSDHDDVHTLGYGAAVALIASRLAWIYTLWSIPPDDPRFSVANESPYLPACCPETGARHMDPSYKKCELCQLCTLVVMGVLMGVLNSPRDTLPVVALGIAAFFVSCGIFFYRLRKVRVHSTLVALTGGVCWAGAH